MTATKADSGYVSQLCVHGRHDRCKGTWGTTTYTCPHHTEPPPEVLGEIAAALTELGTAAAVELATPAHSAGVASVGYAGKLAQAVCSCGWAAAEARRRNHDAFEDARDHLAVTLPAEGAA